MTNIMRWLAVLAVIFIGPALAQTGTPKSKGALSTEISNCFPDNTNFQITPAITRACFQDFLASWQQYANVRSVTGTTDTIGAADYGQLVSYNSSAAIAVTVPQPAGATFGTFNVFVSNIGVGTATFTPTIGTIGGAATYKVPQNSWAWFVSDGSGSNWAVVGNYGKTRLTANLTVWVNGNSVSTAACGPTGASTCAAGSDSNNCLTPATACLTLQHAVNLINFSYDLNGFTATINLSHNTGTANYAFICEAGPIIGQSVFGIQGDSGAPTAVVMQATTSVAAVKDGCTVSISNVAMLDNGSNNASAFVVAGTGQYGHVDLSNISFGALGIGTAVTASYGGSITLVGTNAVTGSENAFVSVSGGGVVDIVGTVAGSASITWGTAAAVVQSGGTILDVTGSTFTGFSGVSGPRCFMSSGPPSPDSVNPNSVFPGSTDCVVGTYVGSLGLQQGSGGSSSIGYGALGQPMCSGGSSSALDTWCTQSQQMAFAPAVMLLGKATGVNFNAANSDQPITLALPTGFTRYMSLQVQISHASASLTTATFGLFNAAAGGGTAVIAGGTAITVSSASDGAANNAQIINAANASSWFSLASFGTLYFRVGTAEGSAATGDVSIFARPVP